MITRYPHLLLIPIAIIAAAFYALLRRAGWPILNFVEGPDRDRQEALMRQQHGLSLLHQKRGDG
jgi:hypothetical protein